jgi:hypothetical protein
MLLIFPFLFTADGVDVLESEDNMKQHIVFVFIIVSEIKQTEQ